MTEMCRRYYYDILHSYYWIYVQLVGVNMFLIYCMGRVQHYFCKITVNKNIYNVMLCILLCDNRLVYKILLTVETLRYFVILEVP
jgi:hypothetical protein